MSKESQLDHDHFRFRPLPSRPALRWPGNERVALCIFVHFEDWSLDLPNDAVGDPRFTQVARSSSLDYLTQSWFEYGNRIGMSRILDALDRHRFRVTVAAGSSATERYPELVSEFKAREYEFAAHGRHANSMISSRLSAEDERKFIRDCLNIVEKNCGTRPVGWCGPGFGESSRTPKILSEEGMLYVADWSNDDQPYPMTSGALISIPYQAGLDDVELLYHRCVLPWNYPPLLLRAFERLYAEGSTSGRFLGLHIHPWILGKAHMITHLEEILAALSGAGEVWSATASDVARHVREVRFK